MFHSYILCSSVRFYFTKSEQDWTDNLFTVIQIIIFSFIFEEIYILLK